MENSKNMSEKKIDETTANFIIKGLETIGGIILGILPFLKRKPKRRKKNVPLPKTHKKPEV